jgi:hypothetical protein
LPSAAKKGCLETEASGRALTHLFREKIKNGYARSITKDLAIEDVKTIPYHPGRKKMTMCSPLTS